MSIEQDTHEGAARREALLDPAEVAQQATKLAKDTLDYYQSSSLFRVETKRDRAGKEVATVSFNVAFESEDPHYIPYQEMEFENGALTTSTAELEEKFYQLIPAIDSIILHSDNTSSANAQWHLFKGIITPYHQVLTEISRIQAQTGLTAAYRPFLDNDDAPGFQLESVNLNSNSDFPLSDKDVSKFLPEGRFIPLKSLLSTVIDPFRADVHGEKVLAISSADGFPKLDYNLFGEHAPSFVTTLDGNDEIISGFAHPLKDDPDGWLVFARFAKGNKFIGRALIVTVDRESIQVEERGGVPTILVNTSVDGEPFELEVPEQRGSWKEYTPENAARATITEDYPDIDGDTQTRCFVPLTADELRNSIGRGYYFDRVVDGAVTAFYENTMTE
jgi:hypothetical protein